MQGGGGRQALLRGRVERRAGHLHAQLRLQVRKAQQRRAAARGHKAQEPRLLLRREAAQRAPELLDDRVRLVVAARVVDMRAQVLQVQPRAALAADEHLLMVKLGFRVSKAPEVLDDRVRLVVAARVVDMRAQVLQVQPRAALAADQHLMAT